MPIPRQKNSCAVIPFAASSRCSGRDLAILAVEHEVPGSRGLMARPMRPILPTTAAQFGVVPELRAGVPSRGRKEGFTKCLKRGTSRPGRSCAFSSVCSSLAPLRPVSGNEQPRDGVRGTSGPGRRPKRFRKRLRPSQPDLRLKRNSTSGSPQGTSLKAERAATNVVLLSVRTQQV